MKVTRHDAAPMSAPVHRQAAIAMAVFGIALLVTGLALAGLEYLTQWPGFNRMPGLRERERPFHFLAIGLGVFALYLARRRIR